MASRVLAEAPAIRRRSRVIAREEVRLHGRGLVVAVLRLSHYAIEQFLFDIEKAQAKISHEPLEGGARGKIHTALAHVNGSVAGSLHDVGINISAARMGQIAHGL